MADLYTRIVDIDTELAGLSVKWKSVSPGTEQAAEGVVIIPAESVASVGDILAVCEAEARKKFGRIKLVSDRGKSPVFLPGDKAIRL